MTDDDEVGTPVGEPVRPSGAHGVPAASRSERHAQAVGNGDQDGEESLATLQPVSADMQQFIGRQLRAVFDDVARQPVPDRFLELMKQLDSKTGVG